MNIVGFEVLKAESTKNEVFWLVTPYSSERGRRLEGTYRLHLQGKNGDSTLQK
jgi:hypothetical protein